MNRGHLEELRPGVWRYRAPAPKGPDGKDRRHSRTFSSPAGNRKAAEKAATAILAEWDRSDTATAAQRGTVAELVHAYVELRARKDSPTTIYRRQAIIGRILTDLGPLRLDQLTARHLDRWYATLATPRPVRRGARTAKVGLSANTIRQYHATVKAILQQGYRWDMVPGNVADKASPPALQRTDQTARTPTPEAMGLIVAKASRSVRVALMLSAVTGSRRGEVVALCWSDLDGDMLTVARSLAQVPGQPLRVKDTKAHKVKRVRLPGWAVEMLAEHRVESREWAEREGVRYVDDGPILANQRADPPGRTPFPPDWFSQEWERCCHRAGVPGYTLHGIRHMTATVMSAAAISPAAAAKRQGQSVEVMMARYVHVLDAEDERAVEVISDAIGPAFGA